MKAGRAPVFLRNKKVRKKMCGGGTNIWPGCLVDVRTMVLIAPNESRQTISGFQLTCPLGELSNTASASPRHWLFLFSHQVNFR